MGNLEKFINKLAKKELDLFIFIWETFFGEISFKEWGIEDLYKSLRLCLMLVGVALDSKEILNYLRRFEC